MNHLVVALGGPTASGKTAWSIKLAHAINGVVIAADSRTVYRGLDIGTGKVTSELPARWEETPLGPVAIVDGIWHLGLDLVDPMSRYTAADFQRYVLNLLPAIWQLNRVPLLVGGTGLYIEAVLRGYQFPSAAALPRQWQEKRTEELAAELRIWDPITAKTIDPQNRRRLERALAYSFKHSTSFQAERHRVDPGFSSRLFLIDRPRVELYERIDRRIEEWLRAGLLTEIEQLLSTSASPDRLREFGLVYKEALAVVQHNQDVETFKIRLAGQLHAYARRQVTWWRRDPDAVWVSRYTELERLAKRFVAEGS